MKIKYAPILVLAALLAPGCSHMKRSSTGYLSEVSNHPEYHLGELVSSFGVTSGIREENGSTVFQVTTPNYAHSFLVSFAGTVPSLDENGDVYFLGTVAGRAHLAVEYNEFPIAIDAVAVKTLRGRAVWLPGREELASSWLDGTLELTGGKRVGPPPAASRAELPAAPAPAVAEQPPAHPAAPPATPAAVPAASPAAQEAAAENPSWALIREKWRHLSRREMTKILEQVWPDLPPDIRARIVELSGDGKH